MKGRSQRQALTILKDTGHPLRRELLGVQLLSKGMPMAYRLGSLCTALTRILRRLVASCSLYRGMQF